MFRDSEQSSDPEFTVTTRGVFSVAGFDLRVAYSGRLDYGLGRSA